MRLDSAFLAESYSCAGGVVTVKNGWPEWWNIESIPGTTELLLVLVAEVEPSENEETFNFDLMFRHGEESVPIGGIPLNRGGSIEFVDGAPLYVSGYVKLNATFHTVGPCAIDVSHDGQLLKTVRFVARLKP